MLIVAFLCMNVVPMSVINAVDTDYSEGHDTSLSSEINSEEAVSSDENEEQQVQSSSDNLLENDELENRIEELNEGNTEEQIEINDVTTFAVTGDGTETNPYTAGTALELKEVMDTINNDWGSGPYYVKLVENIVYTEADVFEFFKDVEIDGQGYSMLYSNSSGMDVTNTGYRMKASNLKVKLKNMNFGSATIVDENGNAYNRSSYYGIIGSGTLANFSFEAILENVNYYSKNGAQPFFSYNFASAFTLMGENSFISEAGENSQEFMKGYNLIFAEGSKTTINHQTDNEAALFHGHGGGGAGDGQIRVTLEKDAEVAITSNKSYFSYGSNGLNLTVGENARFFYTQTESKPLIFTNGVDAEINLQTNAKTEFISSGEITSDGSVVINANAPDYIRFQNKEEIGGLFGKTMTFNRLDGTAGEIGGYQYSYLDANQELLKKDVPGASTFSLSNDSFDYTSLKQAVYQKKLNLLEWESNPTVEVDRSELTTTITSYDPADMKLAKNTFKLSTEPLWSGEEITEAIAQKEVEEASDSTPGIVEIHTSADLDWTLEQLPAGTYYIYVKIAGAVNEDPDLQLYLSESLWEEKQIEIVKSPLTVEVPLELVFTAREIGAFSEEASPKPIISRTNYPIDFTIESVQDLSETSPIQLVKEMEAGREKQLILNLADTDGSILGPLVAGTNEVASLEVLPFLEEPLGIYLKGEYSGPVFEKYETNYAFTYRIAAQGG